MVDAAIVPAIKAAIRVNELGPASPYQLSFAGRGTSGASFGVFQGDTNSNLNARAVLQQALAAAGNAAEDIARIVAAVSKPCLHNPLTPADTALADAALAAASGMALVDAMDAALERTVLGYVDRALEAAGGQNLTLAPAVQIYVALWSNMTGPPDTLNRWLGGNEELGLAPPAGPVVARADVEAYLQATSFFKENPRNFAHLSAAADAGLAALAPG